VSSGSPQRTKPKHKAKSPNAPIESLPTSVLPIRSAKQKTGDQIDKAAGSIPE
jgi:hypothetical protein